MTFSEILNILLGGGLVATLVGIITLKAAVRKANAEAARAQAEAKKAEAEAEKARAEAETVRITNAENATRILVENIVKPLENELYATREDLQDTKKEMASTKRAVARLTKAVEAANDCRHNVDCPVRHRLRLDPKISLDGVGDGTDGGEPRHDDHSDKTNTVGDSAGEPGGVGHIRGQPP